MAHQCAIEDVVFKTPDEYRRYKAAILASLIDEVIAGPYQQDVFEDARHLVGFADSAEEVFIGLGFPIAETRAGPGAGGTALLAVNAVVEAQLFFDMERDVLALFVFIPDHVVGAGDDATSAAGAQAVSDDFAVQLFPLSGPALLLGGSVGWRLDRRHAGDCTPQGRSNINPSPTESDGASLR